MALKNDREEEKGQEWYCWVQFPIKEVVWVSKMAKPGFLSTSLGSGHCLYTVALETLGCLLFAFCERVKTDSDF